MRDPGQRLGERGRASTGPIRLKIAGRCCRIGTPRISSESSKACARRGCLNNNRLAKTRGDPRRRLSRLFAHHGRDEAVRARPQHISAALIRWPVPTPTQCAAKSSMIPALPFRKSARIAASFSAGGRPSAFHCALVRPSPDLTRFITGVAAGESHRAASRKRCQTVDKLRGAKMLPEPCVAFTHVVGTRLRKQPEHCQSRECGGKHGVWPVRNAGRIGHGGLRSEAHPDFERAIQGERVQAPLEKLAVKSPAIQEGADCGHIPHSASIASAFAGSSCTR